MIIYTNRASLSKWDARFLELAEHVAALSKGPRKRIGAVIVRPDKSIASLGYNGPPRGFDDEAFLRMTRDEQHSVVIHAEDNALRQTHDAESVAGYTLCVIADFDENDGDVRFFCTKCGEYFKVLEELLP